MLNIPQEERKLNPVLFILRELHMGKTSRCLAMWHHSRTGPNSPLDLNLLSPGLSHEQ